MFAFKINARIDAKLFTWNHRNDTKVKKYIFQVSQEAVKVHTYTEICYQEDESVEDD